LAKRGAKTKRFTISSQVQILGTCKKSSAVRAALFERRLLLGMSLNRGFDGGAEGFDLVPGGKAANDAVAVVAHRSDGIGGRLVWIGERRQSHRRSLARLRRWKQVSGATARADGDAEAAR